MSAPEGRVLAQTDGPLGWIIFDNPARLNALSEDMSAQALEIVRDFVQDDTIRVLILRGAGTKAFISGGDISKFQDKAETREPGDDRRNYDALKSAIGATGKPVLAMIHGYCLGGGLGLALSADIRLAASSARLGIPAAKRALGYPWQHMKTLVDIVGPAVAKDIMLSGRQIEGDEALRMGLVNRLIPTEALERETRAYAQTLAENAPLTIRAAKICIDELMRDSSDIGRMQALIDEASNSTDFLEATEAFLAKRKPVFRGT